MQPKCIVSQNNTLIQYYHNNSFSSVFTSIVFDLIHYYTNIIIDYTVTLLLILQFDNNIMSFINYSFGTKHN